MGHSRVYLDLTKIYLIFISSTPENVSIEYRESFDAALATADIFSATNCTYPDDKVPKFQPTIKDLMAECRKLSKTLLKLLGIALKGNSSFFLECHSNLDDPTIPSYSQLRSLYYPSIDKQGASVEGATRCAEHTDYGTLTLLMQDSMGGLEVRVCFIFLRAWLVIPFVMGVHEIMS